MAGAVGEFACTAVELNSLDLLKKIVDYGGDVTTSAKANGTTALHLAVGAGNVVMAEYLLENGADADASDDHGWTPRALAEHQGQEVMKSLFLTKGPQLVLAMPDEQQQQQQQQREHNRVRFPTLLPVNQEKSRRVRPRRTNNFRNSLFGVVSAAHVKHEGAAVNQYEPPRITMSCCLQRGRSSSRKLARLPDSFEELYEIAGKAFGVFPEKIEIQGAEIDCIELIRDGDHLVIVGGKNVGEEEEEDDR
ncbi:RAC-alpha serine/threonine-protein kinase [Dionaea muscipula]